ncbi:hypothetical protein DFP72DRAFT_991344 [Ephemerocybe angulata]|uniref:C2H2-type domain-containing protein n=1 Tax=Ephemerocybe angulata TaxID=980116 RepID=A0A8H6HRM1_9AGAR|nr:hypothetical protein DFP72DRAFT_991344 [Tulosesus angulatus]
MPPRQFKEARYICDFPGCSKPCKSPSGLTQHKAWCKHNPANQYAHPTTPSPPPANPPNPAQAPAPQSPPPQSPLLPDPPSRGPSPASDGSPQPAPSTPGPRRARQIHERSGISVRKHPYLSGDPCDPNGFELPPGSEPQPDEDDDDPLFPFDSPEHFLLAEFLYSRVQMSAGNINYLMTLWNAYQQQSSEPPYGGAKSLYSTIDSIPYGNIPWEGFKVKYDGELPAGDVPTWMTQEYEVWFRNPLDVMEAQLANPEFAHDIDYAAKEVKSRDGKRQYIDLMSGEWAWEQSNELAESDPALHGAMFAPVVLGSDKTTVSVGTGQNEYYPLYGSLGNAQNHIRRAHKGALSILGFLAIPKTTRDEQDSPEFRRFRRQLLHSSIAKILMPLRRWMTKARVTKCGDGHWRRVVYGLGPYIADYPEQCILSCVVSGWCPRCTAKASNLDGTAKDANQRSHIHTDGIRQMTLLCVNSEQNHECVLTQSQPFTSYFPRANIHDLLSPDLLHQIIKGTFKDHLVTWVVEYLESQDGGKELSGIFTHPASRISVSPHFPGLRRFPDGRGFKQWTGNDSKALMRVFLPAITGLVPEGMVRAVAVFLEFCYLVRRSQISEEVLDKIDDAVRRFHAEREVFREHGIRNNFNLPRQHSLTHYRALVQMFGAPNGLCSSITESKHIQAVKETWRRSSRNQPLGEMLLTNQRLDKLAAARVQFEPLIPPHLRDPRDQRRTIQTRRAMVTSIPEGDEPEDPSQTGPSNMMTSEGDVRLPIRPGTFQYLGIPALEEYIRRFLYDQYYPDSDIIGMDAPLDECPHVDPNLHIKLFLSATALYHAPSDVSGIGGMHREVIRATPSWQKGRPCHDCVYVELDPDEPGFRGMNVAQVQMFLSFKHGGQLFQCALVRWFEPYDDQPCNLTGLWRVQPDMNARGRRRMTLIIHIDSILRSAHLLPVFGTARTPKRFHHSKSLTSYKLFYVNKYIDYHAYEIAF